MYIPFDEYTIVAHGPYQGTQVISSDQMDEIYEKYFNDYVIWYRMDIVAGTQTLAAARAALRLLKS